MFTIFLIHRIPATIHSHQVREYASATARSSSGVNAMRMLMPASLPSYPSPRETRIIAEPRHADVHGRGGTLGPLTADTPSTYFPYGRYRRRVRLVAPMMPTTETLAEGQRVFSGLF